MEKENSYLANAAIRLEKNLQVCCKQMKIQTTWIAWEEHKYSGFNDHFYANGKFSSLNV